MRMRENNDAAVFTMLIQPEVSFEPGAIEYDFLNLLVSLKSEPLSANA